jgi:hypothetical protein
LAGDLASVGSREVGHLLGDVLRGDRELGAREVVGADARRFGVLDVGQSGLSLDDLLDAVALDRPGEDGVDRDVVAAQFLGERPRQPDERHLRGGVRRPVGVGPLAADGPDVDDAGPVALAEVRGGVLRTAQRAGDVDRLHVEELLGSTRSKGSMGPATPALLTTQSRPPKVSAVSSTAAATDSSSVTSVSTGSIRGVAASPPRFRRSVEPTAPSPIPSAVS